MRIGSGFGYRAETFHWGVDFATSEPIKALNDGLVTCAGYVRQTGFCDSGRGVIIESPDYILYYGNVSPIVRAGQKVVKGEIIGSLTLRDKVHLEAMEADGYVDPIPYLKGDKPKKKRARK